MSVWRIAKSKLDELGSANACVQVNINKDELAKAVSKANYIGDNRYIHNEYGLMMEVNDGVAVFRYANMEHTNGKVTISLWDKAKYYLSLLGNGDVVIWLTPTPAELAEACNIAERISDRMYVYENVVMEVLSDNVAMYCKHPSNPSVNEIMDNIWKVDVEFRMKIERARKDEIIDLLISTNVIEEFSKASVDGSSLHWKADGCWFYYHKNGTFEVGSV